MANVAMVHGRPCKQRQIHLGLTLARSVMTHLLHGQADLVGHVLQVLRQGVAGRRLRAEVPEARQAAPQPLRVAQLGRGVLSTMHTRSSTDKQTVQHPPPPRVALNRSSQPQRPPPHLLPAALFGFRRGLREPPPPPNRAFRPTPQHSIMPSLTLVQI